MSRERQTPPEPGTAVERFVALDASATDETLAAAWTDESADHEAALLRCTAAVAIARGLADDPELRWAYEEAASIASGNNRAVRGSRGRRLAWTGAGLAAAAFATAALVLALRAPPQSTSAPALAPAPAASRAAEIVATAAPVAPVVLLPGGVAVDANSVAVLPFELAGDPGRNAGALLENAIVADLAAVPGIYVVRGGGVLEPYPQSDLSAPEIGVLLGTRGILRTQVEWRPAGVRIHAQLVDAATDRVVWRADYDEPLGDLSAVRAPLVEGIAATLVDPALRRAALGGVSPARPDNTLASVAEPASDR